LTEEKEPTAIVEIGGAANWDFPGGGSLGPTVGVEFTPIKDWLETEIGTGPFFGSGPAQWSTDLLFKKPFDLSQTAELGLGWDQSGLVRLVAAASSGWSLPPILCSSRGLTESMAGS
jgi:hypothetical protein